MRLRLLVPGCALATCLLYAGMSTAQTTNPTDSAYFDLGRVKLKKNFTQNITIRGDDLHRFPFVNLTDALNVWFSGIYTTKTNQLYVVDGKLVIDANQYPIQDIEEITLVQNAVGAVNGAKLQQQLILIKTKKHLTESSGIEVSVLTNAIQLQKHGSISAYMDEQPDTKIFQQYYLSAYKNFSKVHLGLSANYQRDLNPVRANNNASNIISATHNRWRLNGYLNADIWKGSTLDVNIGYTPQSVAARNLYFDPYLFRNTQNSQDEKLINSAVTLTSQLLPGLTNQLKTTYVRSQGISNYLGSQSSSEPNHSYNNFYSSYTNIKTDNILLSDELRYTKSAGDITFSPAVNFSYRYIKTSGDYDNYVEAQFKQFGTYNSKQKTSLLTPSLIISYKDLINVTGGLLYIVKADHDPDIDNYKRTFPFFTATVDATHLICAASPINVKLYSSYALSNNFNDTYFVLSNIYNRMDYPYNAFTSINNYADNSTAGNYFKTLTLGTDVGLFNNKLTLSYNFEKRDNYNYVGGYYYQNASYYNSTTLAKTKFSYHRIAAAFKLINNNAFKWQTGLNTTTIKEDINFPYPYFPYLAANKNIWTGGFTNRLQYKDWVSGIDMLYLFGKGNYTAPTEAQSINSFSLQNAYVGYNIKTNKLKNLEVYANGRNLLQNENSAFNNYNRYFGLGFKAGI